MRKWAFCIAIIAVISEAYGQRLNEPMWLGQDRNAATLNLHVGYAADGLASRFVNTLLFDERLEEERISEQSEKLRTSSRFGGDARFELHGVAQVKNGWALTAGISDVTHASASFVPNAFDLAFHGNTAYQGDSLILSGTRGRFERYQKLSLGAMYHVSDFSIGVELSAINGEQHGAGGVRRGELYTSELGDTLYGNVLLEWSLSNREHMFPVARNGSGLGLDFFMKKGFEQGDSRWDLTFMVRDLGWVQWVPGSERGKVDTVVQFTGIEVTEFASLEGGEIGEEVSDSLNRARTGWVARGVINSFLPMWIQCSVQQSVIGGMEIGAGITWRPTTVARSYGWLETRYRFNEVWLTGLELGYGGFGRFQVGIKGQYVKKRFSTTVRLSNIEAMLLPSRFGGWFTSCGIQYAFGR